MRACGFHADFGCNPCVIWKHAVKIYLSIFTRINCRFINWESKVLIRWIFIVIFFLVYFSIISLIISRSDFNGNVKKIGSNFRTQHILESHVFSEINFFFKIALTRQFVYIFFFKIGPYYFKCRFLQVHVGFQPSPCGFWC